MTTRGNRRCWRSGTRFALALIAIPATTAGCVARTTYDNLQDERTALLAERARLREELERVSIERDSFEEQFVEAQESYEDERIVRTTLASNLARISEEANTLGENLDAERLAHLQAASALAAREAEIAAMQSTYDELVGDLESEVSAGQIEIERLREGLRLNVSDDVLFASGSADLDRRGRAVLVKVAGQVAALDDFVEVRGHTDDRRIRGALAKRFPTNWELAAARAARVVRLLEEQGVPGERLAVISLGPNDPIAPNDSAKSRARNRRIEIRLIPRRQRAERQAAATVRPVAPSPAEPTVGDARAEAAPAAPIPPRSADEMTAPAPVAAGAPVAPSPPAAASVSAPEPTPMPADAEAKPPLESTRGG